ncbi:UDP-4-amino-4,6-dideoxy-N-acetyl-beta-L-altrosamine transaminase [Catenovulum maritimum]|uniref:Spore coat protein n=1 Tax=Catenovulum maritimum TaxID=1513271 RepID=A0A0J8GZF3_9ALTE|nr:UDP-4-amino-4,6-dideoxy-N-acetyl-beta-L-altrosamine transaminase [Catenovulum maritimum]KMT66614.1 spore coat protein [Catenovulum maritimum]
MIPYGKHHIDDDDVNAVVDVLKNQFLTQGVKVPEFEQALCDFTQAQYSLVVNSATSALHLACLSLGVTAGDIVWTTPITFVASANSARLAGAQIDFVDINPITHNICADKLATKLALAKQENSLPKAIIVVHFAGLSCDMLTIAKLTKKYNVKIIEDACHALGGQYLGSMIGSCQYSDISVFSFHPVKSITTAEGGAVLTNSRVIIDKARLLAKHGVSRDIPATDPELNQAWCYQQTELGLNYRLSDLNAALGISQLKKLPDFVKRRRLQAQRYFEGLQSLPLQLPEFETLHQSAWHLYTIELLEHDRGEVYQQLIEAGIGVNVHYIPVHWQPYYQALGFQKGDFENAETYYRRTLSLPIFPTMTAKEQNKVIETLTRILS